MRNWMVLAALAVLLWGCGAAPKAPATTPSPTAASVATSPAPNATVAPPAADATIPTVEAMAAARTELPASPTPALPPGVVAAIDVGGNAFGTAADRDSLWVQVDPPGDGLVRIDARTNKITASIPDGRNAAFGAGSLWVATGDRGVLRVDPENGKVLARIPDVGASYLAYGEGAVWAPIEGEVARIDPETDKVVATIPVDCADKALAVGEGSVWLACRDDRAVVRVDVRSNKQVANIPTGDAGAHDIAVTPGAVWVTDTPNEMARIDPRTNKVVAVIPNVGGGVGITSAGGELWASDASGIARIDTRTNKVVRRIELGPGFYYGLEHVGKIFWVSDANSTRVYRVEP